MINTASQHHRRISQSATPEMVAGLRTLSTQVKRAATSRSRALRAHVRALSAAHPMLGSAVASGGASAAHALGDEIRKGIARLADRRSYPIAID